MKLIILPFAALLKFFYHITGSYGLALFLFTLAIKLIILPFQMKSKKSMMRLGRLQPQMKDIQTRYANNRVLMNEEIQKLYQQEGINPMGGCLWSLLPMPILFMLYYIIRRPLTDFMMLSEETVEAVRTMALDMGWIANAGKNAELYEEINLAKFISNHFDAFSAKFEGLLNMDYSFLGMDLSIMPTEAFSQIRDGGLALGLVCVIAIPIVSAALTVLQTKITMSTQGQAQEQSMKMMNWMMPLMSLYIGFILPAALGMYWIYNSLLTILQELILGKKFKKQLEAEEALRQERLKETRRRRAEEARARELAAAEAAKQKKTKKEKDAERQAEKLRQAEKKKSGTNENGRVGERPYARGRSYQEERYDEK